MSPPKNSPSGARAWRRGGCGGNSARRVLKRKRKGRFQVFHSAFGGTPSFARFGGKFFLVYSILSPKIIFGTVTKHRLNSLKQFSNPDFEGIVEVDETYLGG